MTFVLLAELPISGFTSHCLFRRSLTYLRESNFHCLQTKLNMNNNDLFIEAYNNFTIISSPIFLNSSLYTLSTNQVINIIFISIKK